MFGQRCLSVLDSSNTPVHLEYIDDMILKLKQSSLGVVMPILDACLWSIGLKLNRLKSKALIPSAFEGSVHAGLHEVGIEQV